MVVDSCSDSVFVLLSELLFCQESWHAFLSSASFFCHSLSLLVSSSSSPSLSLFLDVSIKFELEDLQIDDKNSFSSLSHTTNSKFLFVNHNVGVRQEEVGYSCESSCLAHHLSLWSCDACPDGQTGRQPRQDGVPWPKDRLETQGWSNTSKHMQKCMIWYL